MSLEAEVYLGSAGLEPVATDSDGVVLPVSEKESGGGWYIVEVPDDGADFTVEVDGIAPVVCSARPPVDLTGLATDATLQQGLADNAAAVAGIEIPKPDLSGLATSEEVAAAVEAIRGQGSVVRAFTSVVNGVAVAGVRVSVFLDSYLSVPHGGCQISDGAGKTYWNVDPGTTYYFHQQKDGYAFGVEREVG